MGVKMKIFKKHSFMVLKFFEYGEIDYLCGMDGFNFFLMMTSLIITLE